MSGIRFLSLASANNLTLVDLKMHVSERGPEGLVNLSLTANLDSPETHASEDGSHIMVKCRPGFLITIKDSSSDRTFAEFEVETIAEFGCEITDGNEPSWNDYEKLFCECMLCAYYFTRDKFYELTAMSSMRRLLLPNTFETGMLEVVRNELAEKRREE